MTSLKLTCGFLKQYEEIHLLEKEISSYNNLESLPKALLLEAKQKGFADRQIAHMIDCWESEVHEKRTELNINRVFKLVDTCAAEFQAQTPYYYSTFESDMIVDGKAYSENESVVTDQKKNSCIRFRT